MPNTALARLCLTIALLIPGWPASAQSILLDHRTATYGNPFGNSANAPAASSSTIGMKTLVSTSALPAKGEFEILGPLSVQSSWPGGTAKATRLLAEQAKGMGANAVVEARVWQAFAFPALFAPHGSGIAVRIKDDELLRSLAGSGSTWE